MVFVAQQPAAVRKLARDYGCIALLNSGYVMFNATRWRLLAYGQAAPPQTTHPVPLSLSVLFVDYCVKELVDYSAHHTHFLDINLACKSDEKSYT